MENKKVLVIGGNGFIGRNLCQTLAERGMAVYSFDIEEPEEIKPGIEYIKGDFFNDEELKEIVKDKEMIVHAISTINPGNSSANYFRGYEKDLLQTVKLCSMLTEKNEKIVFLSSGGTVYGNQKEQPIKESALPLPINHYGNVKLCIENVMRTFDVLINTKFLIARVSNPYGPGQDYTKGVGFVDAAVKKTLKGEPIEIWGNGEVVRDYIHIEDVCEMLYALMSYEGEETTFNISSNEGISQNKVLEILEALEPKIEKTYKPGRSVDCEKIILDNSKFMEVYKKDILPFSKGIQSYYSYLKSMKKQK